MYPGAEAPFFCDERSKAKALSALEAKTKAKTTETTTATAWRKDPEVEKRISPLRCSQ
jgi:hypothetical protein